MAVAAEGAEYDRAAGEVGAECYSVFQNNIAIVAGRVLDKLLKWIT